MAKKAAAKKATKFVTSIRKGGDKKPTAKKKAAKAVKFPAIKPGTIADVVAQFWPDIGSLDAKQWRVGSLKSWLEGEVKNGKGEIVKFVKNAKENVKLPKAVENVKDMELAITALEAYDEKADPFTAMVRDRSNLNPSWLE